MNIRLPLATVLVCALSVGSGWGFMDFLSQAGEKAKALERRVSESDLGKKVTAGASDFKKKVVESDLGKKVSAVAGRLEPEQAELMTLKVAKQWGLALKKAQSLQGKATKKLTDLKKAATDKGLSAEDLKKDKDIVAQTATVAKWTKEVAELTKKAARVQQVDAITKKYKQAKDDLDDAGDVAKQKPSDTQKASDKAQPIADKVVTAQKNLTQAAVAIAALIRKSEAEAAPLKTKMDADAKALAAQEKVAKSIKDKMASAADKDDEGPIYKALKATLKTAEAKKDALKKAANASKDQYADLKLKELYDLQKKIDVSVKAAPKMVEQAQAALQKIKEAEESAAQALAEAEAAAGEGDVEEETVAPAAAVEGETPAEGEAATDGPPAEEGTDAAAEEPPVKEVA